MSKILRVLGRRGRITIPFELRVRLGFAHNDILSVREGDGNEIIIRREKLCDGCKTNPNNDRREAVSAILKGQSMLDLLDELSPEQQYNALVHLSLKWSEREAGGVDA